VLVAFTPALASKLGALATVAIGTRRSSAGFSGGGIVGRLIFLGFGSVEKQKKTIGVLFCPLKIIGRPRLVNA
jgi:hypothetical protein